jgi:transcriptional regulator with XRE-family HTH domain
MIFKPEKLIDLRWSRKMKQNAVALAIGVRPSVVNAWEHGRAIPSAPMLMKLSLELGVDPIYFFD